MESKNIRNYESAQSHHHTINEFPHDEKQTAIANKKREVFVQTLKREFIRELQFLWDVANGRAVARDTFITTLAAQLKNLSPRLPVIGDAIDKLSTAADFAAKRERDICIGRAANLADQLDWQHLDILMDLVSKEALRRYESIIVDRLSDDPAEGVIPFAKVGARRMLEKLSRTQTDAKEMKDIRIILNESTLLSGLIEGRSGSFVEGFSNTKLSLKRKDKKLEAEDCYARAGMRYFEIRDGQQVDELYIRRPKAKHQEGSTWKKLASTYKGHPEAFYNFGYVKFRKKKKENHNDPKVGYVVMPLAVIKQRYDFELQEVVKGQTDKPVKEKEISHELKAEVRSSSHSIIVVDRATVEKFLTWSMDEKNQDKAGKRLGLLDYVKTVLKYPLVSQVVCHDNLIGLDLRGANLSHVDLSGAEIGANAEGQGGDLTDTDFSHSYLIGSVFKNITSTKGAKFHQARAEFLQAQGTDFMDADLRLANFSYSKLGKIKNCQTLGAVWIKAEFNEEMKESEIITKTQVEQTKLLNELQLQIQAINEQQKSQMLSEEKIQQEIKALEKKLTETTTSKSDKSELESLQKQIKELQKKLQKLQNEIVSEKQFSSVKSQLEEKIEKLGNQQEALKEIIHKLEGQLQDQLETVTNQQVKQHQQLEKELVALEQTINQWLKILEARVDQLETDTNQMKALIGDVRKEEDKLNVRVDSLETKEAKLEVEVGELKQQVKNLTPKTDGELKDEKEKPLDVAELERLMPKLTQILKSYYGSKGTVPGLLSDRPQSIADINLTITEHKRGIRQHFDKTAKTTVSGTGSAGEAKVPSFDPGDAKRGATHSEQKEQHLDQEILDYYKNEHTVQTPIAIEEIFDKRSTCVAQGSNASLSENKRESPTIAEIEPKQLLIFGRPGVGKTTMIQYMANRWAKAKPARTIEVDMTGEKKSSFTLNVDKKEEQPSLALTASLSPLFDSEKTLWANRFDFVFWIPLRHLNRYEKAGDISLAEVIYQECCAVQVENISSTGAMSLISFDQLPSKKELIQAIDYVLKYKKERCLMLMDGGDEIAHLMIEPMSDAIPVASRSIKKLLQQAFEAEYLILTSRPYQIDELIQLNPKGFDQTLENVGFTDEQIECYIQNYFGSREQSKVLVEELSKFLKNSLRIWDIAHIPIHLALICSIWQEIRQEQIFNKETNVTDLYYEIVHHLLKHTLVRRGVDVSNQGGKWIYQQCENEMRLLERLAFEGLKKGKAILNKTIQRQVLDTVEEENKTSSKQPLFIAALEMGLLKAANIEEKEELDKEHYFIHLTFQEFLAARYLVACFNSSNTERVEEAKKFISHYKYTSRYQVFLGFVSGLVSKDKSSAIALTHFWNTLLAQPLDLIGIGHWHIALRCLEEASCDKRISHLDRLLDGFKELVKKIMPLVEYNNSGEPRGFLGLEPMLSFPLICKQAQIMAICIEVIKNKKEQINARIGAIFLLGELGKKIATNQVSEILLMLFNDKTIEPVARSIASCVFKEICVVNSNSELPTRALKNDDDHIKRHGIYALGYLEAKNITEPVIQAVLQVALSDSYWWNKFEAVCVLGSFFKKTMKTSIIQAFLQIVKNDDSAGRDVFSALDHSKEENINITELEIQILLKAAKDENNIVRRVVVFVLGNLNGKNITEPVIQVLLEGIKDSDEDVRKEAYAALDKLKEKNITKSVIEALLQIALKNTDIDTRCATFFILGCLSGKNITEPVIQALLQAAKDDKVRYTAVFALENLEEKAITEPVIQTLLQALKDREESVIYAAVSVLEGFGGKVLTKPGVIEALLQVVGDGCRTGCRAISALGNLEEKAITESVIQSLLQALKNEGWFQYKSAAASALEKLAKKDKTMSVIQALLEAAKNSDKDGRRLAVSALGNLGENNITEPVIKSLLQAVEDNDEYVRSAAVLALVNVGENNITTPVIQALLQALRDKKWWVRHQTLEALNKLEEKNITASVLQALLPVTKDDSESVRDKAVSVFCSLGRRATIESAIQFLVQATKDKNNEIRYLAFRAFNERVGTAALTESMIQILLPAVKDKNADVRRVVFSALRYVEKQTFTESVIQFALKEMGWWWHNNNIKLFLEAASFPLAVLINVYLNNTHSFLPQLIAHNALNQNISITMTETHIILYEGAEPQIFSITPEKRKNLAKSFSVVLKKRGLPDVIPQAYLSQKPVFPLAPVPKSSLTTTRTLHELKKVEAKENTMVSLAMPQVVTNQRNQMAVGSSQTAPVDSAGERKVEIVVSSSGQVTLTLEQMSVLMRQQQMQGGLITPILVQDEIRGIPVAQSQPVSQKKDGETARLA